jgi:hypothetical protein
MTKLPCLPNPVDAVPVDLVVPAADLPLARRAMGLELADLLPEDPAARSMADRAVVRVDLVEAPEDLAEVARRQSL